MEFSVSRTNPPTVASAPILADGKVGDGGKDTRRQRKRRLQRRKKYAGAKVGGEGAKVDEKIRIKRRVKNLVNRIRLEQNLIDAYVGEGWKGNSREKIRPEKELQRADMQILRCKLAIRDLLHDLDSLGLEGSLKESAFDEEGRIFHEEIFCAKCKSQEAFVDNDIILCDGSCDRAFHQECVDPPLATADIPPGDEGWLCPVCDSKAECLNYINGYLGTEFQVEDQWENFFAAAAAVSGGSLNALGEDWPSEDSDDHDYDPGRKAFQNGNKEEQGGGFNVLEASCVDSLRALNSESESSSESYSCSDDDSWSSEVSGDELPDHDGRSKIGDGGSGTGLNQGNMDHTPNIPTATEADEPPEDICLVSGKRHRKPVDYKRLHNEMFGEEFVDAGVQSEDEEWGPGKMGRRGETEGSSGVAKRACNGSEWGKKHRHVRRKSLVGQQSDDVKEHDLIQRNHFFGRKNSKRLPDSAVKMLREEFETGTSFPSRAYKETLAQRLGISFQQVCSWFKNARQAGKHASGQRNPSRGHGKKEANAPSNENLRGREGGGGEMELSNGLLVEKLDEVQLKLHYLKQSLEAIVAKRDVGPDGSLWGKPGDPGNFYADIVMSHQNGKHILYVPVAEVVEKNAEKVPGNGKL